MKILNKNIKLYVAIAAMGLMASCKPTIEIDESNAIGDANFSKYIAIGNSLTAGYADGGLYLSGQINSFPNMIAQKMKRFGGGDFITPYFSEAQRNGSGYIRLKALINGQPVMETVTSDLAIRGFYENNPNKPLYFKYTGPEINNLGVPGMRLDMASMPGLGTSAGNPFFERLLPDGASPMTTYLSFATSRDYTFFSFALGNNDVLGYATNGAVAEDATKVLITTERFQEKYTEFINQLTLNGQKGVVATIPDVTDVPYFTTVTTSALLAAASAAAGVPISTIYIQTKTVVRPATNSDMFVLPFSSSGLLGKASDKGPYGLSPFNPIEDKYVLDQAEVAVVKQRIVEINKVIKTIAADKKLAVADVYSFLNQVKVGYNYNGIAISNRFITGNAFSLDGIHLTPMGYAIMANIYIDAINAQYKTKLEKVDATLYPAVLLP